jgi:hypothetical protein
LRNGSLPLPAAFRIARATIARMKLYFMDSPFHPEERQHPQFFVELTTTDANLVSSPVRIHQTRYDIGLAPETWNGDDGG